MVLTEYSLLVCFPLFFSVLLPVMRGACKLAEKDSKRGPTLNPTCVSNGESLSCPGECWESWGGKEDRHPPHPPPNQGTSYLEAGSDLKAFWRQQLVVKGSRLI